MYETISQIGSLEELSLWAVHICIEIMKEEMNGYYLVINMLFLAPVRHAVCL